MKWWIVAVVVGVSVASAALAQGVQQSEPFPAQFDETPQAPVYSRNYPREAFARSVDGAAVLCCVPDENGYLNCAAALEWPEEHGFGDASVRVAREFHLSPESQAQFEATPGNWIRRTLIWRIGGRQNADSERAFSLIRETTDQLCRPQASQ